MIVEITIPSPGESITEVEFANWLVKDGDYVEKDQEIAEVESDKATLPLMAEKAGEIRILVKTGEVVKVGTVACTIDTSVKKTEAKEKAKAEAEEKAGEKAKAEEKVEEKAEDEAKEKVREKVEESVRRAGTKESVLVSKGKATEKESPDKKGAKATPLARKLMEENGLDIDAVLKGLKKITTKEVNLVLGRKNELLLEAQTKSATREVKKESISQLRKKMSRRLVAVKNETAMLTTFNEVDMSEVIRLRKDYQKQFTETHGVKLGFMSFFVKAATEALLAFPKVNSMLGDDEIIMPQYVDISIAVQTDKGLMVPVLRNTETMSLADIEKNILVLAEKARNFRLSIEEMSGGTFSITNGGVFGSMLSTPILNPPQAAILGMHNIVDRPVAIQGRVEVRPVMYLALSYDHRLIDGKDSVSFLYRIKEFLESPHKMIYGGRDPEQVLLGV